MKSRSIRAAELQDALRVFPTPQPEYVPAQRAGAFARLLAAVRDINDRARSRRELSELDEYALRDIGLSRAHVTAELAKPLWR